MPSLTTLLALGAITSIAAADNIYTYTKSGCAGPAFFFKDIDHNVCAVTITGNATNIADAIAKGITTVGSAKLEGKSHLPPALPSTNLVSPTQCKRLARSTS
jgi:hypothetical protein